MIEIPNIITLASCRHRRLTTTLFVWLLCNTILVGAYHSNLGGMKPFRTPLQIPFTTTNTKLRRMVVHPSKRTIACHLRMEQTHDGGNGSIASSNANHAEQQSMFLNPLLLTRADTMMLSKTTKQQQQQRHQDSETSNLFDPNGEPNDDVSTRRNFLALAIISTGATIAPPSSTATTSEISPKDIVNELIQTKDGSVRDSRLQFIASPVNKRSGITVFEAERAGYNVPFVTYLSRFLLNFDADCQRWWYSKASEIPRTANAEEVNSIRLKQFAAFSASVEVGLQDFRGPNGPLELLRSLVERYSPDADTLKRSREEKGLAPLSAAAAERQQREIKEARRQIALLFGLMERNQPVEELTKLLATIDDGVVSVIEIENRGSGYDSNSDPPQVTFPPPGAGEGYARAVGKTTLRPNGQILRIDILERGSGYEKPPSVTISPPTGANSTSAVAEAVLVQNGPDKGQIQRIDVIDPGSGYTPNDPIKVRISPPESPSSEQDVMASAKAVLEYEIDSIEIVNAGSGYATEKAMAVTVEPPPSPPPAKVNAKAAQNRVETKPAQVTAYAQAEKDSYTSFRSPDDAMSYQTVEASLTGTTTTTTEAGAFAKRVVSGTTSGGDSIAPPLPFWGRGTSSSAQLLSLFPEGYGLEYDSQKKRFTLAVGQGFESQMAEELRKGSLSSSFMPLDPDFGPRGRSPIEREKSLGLSTVLRFCASGAICCSGVHLAVTPIDVVKTKIQTNPTKYPNIITAFQTVTNEEGFGTFFTGWAPTFLGYFLWGGVQYSTTEFFRRYFSELAGANASNLEIPIILLVSSMAAFLGSFVISPFEAVRIRSVAQPDFGDSIVGVSVRMVKEEGIGSLFNTVPAFLFREIPFACGKFTVFYLSTAKLYSLFPAANEDLQLSLLISLLGGTLGGIFAAIVSNPADATISEMKKEKTDANPLEALQTLLARGGIPSLFTGLTLRMFFFALVVSLQFLIYDSIRFALGIGSDDLKLYLDVLGGALKGTEGPV